MSQDGTPTPAQRGSLFGGGSNPQTSLFNNSTPAPRADSPAEEKPVVEKSNVISITVRDGPNIQTFKMKRDRPLQKLMQAAAERLGKDLKSCRFMLDGERIQGTDTPEKLEMMDEDIIEVFTEQIGGFVHLIFY